MASNKKTYGTSSIHKWLLWLFIFFFTMIFITMIYFGLLLRSRSAIKCIHEVLKPQPQPNCSAVLYVACHDEKSAEIANRVWGKYLWANIVRAPKFNPLCESFIFRDVIPAREEEWKDADWVGMVSYQGHIKGQVPDPTTLGFLLDIYDAIAFTPTMTPSMGHEVSLHPDLLKVWRWLLPQLFPNIPMEEFESPNVARFRCNGWITRPSLMREYCDVFHRTNTLIDNNPEMKALMWKDAAYITGKMTPEQCMESFGVPYYPNHPFLFERLPCAFLYAKRARVLNGVVLYGMDCCIEDNSD